MAVQSGSRRSGPPLNIGGDDRHGFDRGFLLLGAGLGILLALGLAFAVRDLVVVTVMTVLLWLSVGAVMVLSRVLGGRWE
jgi:hypothetical protein